jgi:hypothetical protein
MATTDVLTRNYRRQDMNLRAATLRDLQRLWPALDFARIDETFPAWLGGAVTVIRRDRNRAAGLASAYLRAYRLASGVPGTAKVVLADAEPLEQIETSLRVTTAVSAKKGAAAGQSLEQIRANALVRSMGAASRHVLDGGRMTIQQSLAADPQGTGWRRVTSGTACAFCRMLADRGATFSAETADFAGHDHCNCGVEPVYGGDRRSVKRYTPSQRTAGMSDQQYEAHKARLREYLNKNYPRT